MKKILLLFTSLFIGSQGFAQDPDIFRTWYLYEIQATDLSPVYVVADIDPNIQPWVAISETLEFNGEGACNTFMGTYSYDPNGSIFNSADLTETGDDCIIQVHNQFEEGYFNFMQWFQVIDISSDNNGLTMYLSSILLGYAIFKDYPLSINDVNFENTITVYPNPVSDQLFISSENTQIENIRVYSISGKQVLDDSNFENSLDVSGFSEGIYFLEIYSSEGKSVQKFVKQ